MENICQLCASSAEVSCSCDYSLRFCLKHFIFNHQKNEEIHKPIELVPKKEINRKFNTVIKNLKKVKTQIIFTSNQMIQIIQSISIKKISSIKMHIDACKKL